MEINKKDNLLKAIVEEYVKSASPVSSSLVVEKYFPDLSSATIRNYMADLEEEGMIHQPHTSAGRLPTVSGYKHYIDLLQAGYQVSNKNKKILNDLASKIVADESGVKMLAKSLVEVSDNAVLVGFGPLNVYYTGISNLFRQPEFLEQGLVYSMSEVIDHLDEAMSRIFHQIGDEAKILIGEENPFGEMCSVVLVKYHLRDSEGIVGILGPNRMDYLENAGLLKYVQEILGKI
jgi:transcriptional regulator of heat shock response